MLRHGDKKGFLKKAFRFLLSRVVTAVRGFKIWLRFDSLAPSGPRSPSEGQLSERLSLSSAWTITLSG